jgi:hypothetical protein
LLDDDCDGAVDEGLTTPSTCGVGVCSATGENQCVDGVMIDTCTIGAAGTEICNGLDDDCDGAVDEGDICLPTCDSSIELVSNGGFEAPLVTTGVKWNIFNAGTPGLAWNVAWMSAAGTVYKNVTMPAIPKLEIQRGYGGPAASGMQYAELDSDWNGPYNGSLGSEPASVRISQSLPTTPGVTYVLRYAFSPRKYTPASDNVLHVRLNGQTVQTISRAGAGTTSWTYHSYAFVADSAVTTIEFADMGRLNSVGVYLDSVSLRCNLQTARLSPSFVGAAGQDAGR